MAELPDAKTTIPWILLGVLGWIGKVFYGRLTYLERHAVMREEMERHHEENKSRLDEIRDTTTKTHDRIDDLYRDLVKK